jgi:hypothetical protein
MSIHKLFPLESFKLTIALFRQITNFCFPHQATSSTQKVRNKFPLKNIKMKKLKFNIFQLLLAMKGRKGEGEEQLTIKN